MGRYFADIDLFDLFDPIKLKQLAVQTHRNHHLQSQPIWSTNCMTVLLSLYFRIKFTVTDYLELRKCNSSSAMNKFNS